MLFANQFLATGGNLSYVTSELYNSSDPTTVIKADLDYVSKSWNSPGCDLWEEVYGFHFFTRLVQYRALVDGAAFAASQGDLVGSAAYSSQAAQIAPTLAQFWDSTNNWLVANLDYSRSGQDCGNIVASIRTTNETTSSLFPPSDPRVLSSLNSLVNVFAPMYPVNNQSVGIGIGRYPEDKWDGYDSNSVGNPWFLCTSAAAEVVYLTALEALRNQSILTTNLSVLFYSRFLPSVSVGTYPQNSWEYETLLSGLITFGDSFLGNVQQHAFTNGSLSEEFDRYDGYCTGARDLTWSYAAFLTAADARTRLGEAYYGAARRHQNPLIQSQERARTDDEERARLQD